MNLFEIASRKKLRFPSVKGDLTAEQLWDLPLTITSATRDVKADLDTIARSVNAELKSVTEETFVAVKPDPRKPDLETKLEILKHIIAFKVKVSEDAKASAERAEKRRKLVEALASKEDQALATMSKEDILKQLAELEANG
jgi:hypothetical protein